MLGCSRINCTASKAHDVETLLQIHLPTLQYKRPFGGR